MMERRKRYMRPRIKTLDMEELMDLPASIPDPGFGNKGTEFEEEPQTDIIFKRTNVWDE